MAVLVLSCVAPAAGAQLSLHPHVAIGGIVGNGAIPSKSEKLQLNGSVGELGLELDITRGHALAVGGFATGTMNLSLAIENPTIGDSRRIGGPPPQRSAHASGAYVRWILRDNADRYAAGFASALGLSFIRLTDDSRSYDLFAANTAGLEGGISYTTRVVLHVAPTIGARGYLHETSDGRVYRALTCFLMLESR